MGLLDFFKRSEQRQEPIAWYSGEDAAMRDAIAASQATFDRFLAVIDDSGKQPHVEEAFIKYAVPATKGGVTVEHVFVGDIHRKNGRLLGRVNSTPMYTNEIKEGEVLEIHRDRISDWLYVVDGTGVGGATFRLMWSRFSDSDRAAYGSEPPFVWLDLSRIRGNRVGGAMDKEEKRRLKKLGKQVIAEESARRKEALREANPAPIGSDEWAESYRQGTLREKVLRDNPPDRLSATDVAGSFVPNPIHRNLPEGLFGVPGSFWECLDCGDAINSLARVAVRCECGNIAINPAQGVRSFKTRDRVRLVTLIGKGGT
jgi:uncharacterized protein YegJ (DUF2314 family)